VLYIQNLGKIAFFTSLISLPISNFFYSAFEFSEKFIFINFLIIFVGQIFLLLRLYIGWYYIKERLSKASIEYEESGWYDGQIWVKPKKILKQDRLICYYKVFPILNRLEKTIIYLFIVFNLIFLITILI
jgi:hypothetical protein